MNNSGNRFLNQPGVVSISPPVATGSVDSEMQSLGKECSDLADAITDLIVALDPVLRPAGPSTGSSVPTCEPMCELAGRIASARQGITERVALLRDIRQRLAL